MPLLKKSTGIFGKAKTMKAFGIKEWRTDLAALQEYNIPIPTPGKEEVLVKVKAVATNPIDYQRMANELGNADANFESNEPMIPGWDGAGIVMEVGKHVNGFVENDEVYFAGDIFRNGCFAEYVTVDEKLLAKKPKNLDWAEAASFPLTTLTAWEALMDELHIAPNDKDNLGKTILIYGGAGGAATAAIDLAKSVCGLTVIATASRQKSRDYNSKMGADHVIDHHQSLKEQLHKIGIVEVDYVLDTYGINQENLQAFSDVLKVQGSMCTIEYSGTLDLMPLFMKSQTLCLEGCFARAMLHTAVSQRHGDILKEMTALIEANKLKCRKEITFRMDLHNLKKALELQQSGTAVGKMCLVFPE